MTTPQTVLDALEKLDASDRETVLTYIHELEAKLSSEERFMEEEGDATMEDPTSGGAASKEVDNNKEDDDGVPFPPIYESGEDYDKAADLKQEASDCKDSGDWERAVEKYTAAIQAAPPSALLYANRATALLELKRYRAAERDCGLALIENPDSAKALRVRGKARRALGQYELALRDLAAGQQIDFDEGCVEDLKFLTEKHVELEKAEAAERVKEEDKLRKRVEEAKKARNEAKAASAQSAKSSNAGGGMGGGRGMPGGMGGMPGGMEGIMGSLMSDPELMAAMQNPKVMAAFQELMSGPGGAAGLMSNPGKIQELMSDPEVGPVLQKFMAKLGGAMGASGAMGGMPGASGGGADDDIPNLDEMEGDVDLDDLPDLE